MKNKVKKTEPGGCQIFLLGEGEPRMILDTVTGYRDSEAVNALVARWIREGAEDVIASDARKAA